MLRSGHLAHAGNQMPNDLLAIDLSSERVRLATWLLDGVRQGQPLGALLGYRFERRLQEAGKAHFISFFRELAPLVARKLERAANRSTGRSHRGQQRRGRSGVATALAGGAGSSAARNAAARSAARSRFSSPRCTNKPPQADLANAKAALEAELNALADSVDAVSDALMAESVYQVVRGNPVRAAMTVESIAGGETPPPELEVVRTPRTGIALTHRLVTLVQRRAAAPARMGVAAAVRCAPTPSRT